MKEGDRNAWATNTRARQTGTQRLEGHALAMLGIVWHRIGEHHQAIAAYRQALAIHAGTSHRPGYLRAEKLFTP